MTTTPSNVPQVKIGDWLRDGWGVFSSDIVMYMLASFIYTIILIAACVCTCGLGGLILYGPLTCGMYLMIFDSMKGNKADIGRLFAGFNYFGSAFLAGLIFFLLSMVCGGVGAVMSLLCFIGSLVGMAGTVFLVTAFLFTFQIIVRQERSAGDAISMSFDVVKEKFWEFLLFCFVLWLINVAGFVSIVGWLVTTPLTLGASAAAYRDIFGLENQEEIVEQSEQV